MSGDRRWHAYLRYCVSKVLDMHLGASSYAQAPFTVDEVIDWVADYTRTRTGQWVDIPKTAENRAVVTELLKMRLEDERQQ